MITKNRIWRSTVVAAALVIAACGGGTPASSAPLLPSGGPSGNPAIEAALVEAIEFRRQFGLRSDEPWVRAVAADPGAVLGYGVPLTVAEEAELNRRASDVHELGPILQAYGAEHPDEFAGLYVDHESGGRIVVMFTAHVDDHAFAIQQLVRPDARLDVRPAPTAQADLEELMNLIAADTERLRGAGIVVVRSSVDVVSSRIEVGLSTERWDAAGLMTAMYGPGIAVSVVDPTGAFLKPRGTVLVTVVDDDGNGVASCVYATPMFAELDMDAVGCEPVPSGSFRLEDQLPGRWRLTTQAEGFAAESVEILVPPGGIVRTEIRVTPAG